MVFDELSEEAKDIISLFEMFLAFVKGRHDVHFKEPAHDIARRFLNEIEEFEAVEE